MEAVMNEVLLKVEEAGRRIGFSRAKTYKFIQDGELPAIRVGSQLRVPASALDAWVAVQLNKRAKP
jgi:excisionase family DNA binding protein